MEIVISKSTNKNKKFDATINGAKKISFGDYSYEVVTKHKDSQREDTYLGVLGV